MSELNFLSGCPVTGNHINGNKRCLLKRVGQSKEHEHGKETIVRLPEQETKWLKIVTEGMEESSELKKHKEDVGVLEGIYQENLSLPIK